MTHLEGLSLAAPMLPPRARRAPATVLVSFVLHALAAGLVAFSIRHAATPIPDVAIAGRTPIAAPALPRLVFLPDTLHPTGGGGGGGGNRRAEPIRRAEGIGGDRFTLRVRKPLTPAATIIGPEVPTAPGVVLDAKPLASGTRDQIGLPVGGVPYGISTGPGSGGGVGDGTGTGIGSGRGPGIGPGSGGGIGGGVYRVGSGVTAPRLLSQTRPSYTPEALERRITGSVVLEVVVNTNGLPAAIRVTGSLDPGLDEEAIKAVRQWRFAAGRHAGIPVDVLVSIVVDFHIR